jgi:Dehydrogenases with different specificities (related to short-chain alcohol dehydrogenases)
MMSQTDSADEKAIIKLRDAAKERFGKLNILVNNAGTIGEELPCTDMPVEEFDRVLPAICGECSCSANTSSR